MTFTLADSSKTFSEKKLEKQVFQQTLKTSVSFYGKTLFSGKEIHLTICPLEENEGIYFERTDLPGRPLVPAHVSYVKDTPRCTILEKNGVQVRAVEHLLSALKAYGIDNALIKIDGEEIPVGDGSALPFIELIEESGVADQKVKKLKRKLQKPIFWSRNDVHLIALPSDCFRVSYTLNYPNSKRLHAQFFSGKINADIFKREIAPSRTFSLYEEVVPLIQNGIIKGGSLENGIVIKDDEILNPDGLRFPDEMVRHKVLDLIGDLSLIGMPFMAHIISLRSGHASNTALAKELINALTLESH